MPHAKYGRFTVPFAGVGVICLVAAALLGMHDPTVAFRSYLFAYIYWFVIPIGCLGLLMLHHLVGGWWGLPIRRMAEAGTRTLPLTAILFIPVALSMSKLYSWIYDPGEFTTAPNEKLNYSFKLAYLTPHGFIVRAVIYFVIWFAIVVLLNRFSREQDQAGADGTKFALRMEACPVPVSSSPFSP